VVSFRFSNSSRVVRLRRLAVMNLLDEDKTIYQSEDE